MPAIQSEEVLDPKLEAVDVSQCRVVFVRVTHEAPVETRILYWGWPSALATPPSAVVGTIRGCRFTKWLPCPIFLSKRLPTFQDVEPQFNR